MNINETTEPDLLAAIRTGDQLDATEFPPLAWAVHGLIPEGFGLFTGAPKAGKSWAALGIALAVATGTNALGKVPTGRPRPVLLLALEDGERRLKGRCKSILDDAPIPANLHFMTQCKPGLVLETIRQWVDRHGHLNPLVILDTLGKVMPPALPGEGAYQRDYRIGSALKAAVDAAPGSTLLVVHHIRKMNADADWMDSTSGTNGLNGAADFTLSLSRKRNEDNGVIRVTGRDVPESEYAVTVNEGRWVLDGEALADAAAKAEQSRVAENLSDDSAEVLRFVTSQSGGARAQDVAAHMGWPEDKARPYLARLVDADRLVRPKRGLYVGVTSVTSVTNEPDQRNNVTDVTPPVTSVTSGTENVTPPVTSVTSGTENVTDVTLVTPPCRSCGQPLSAVDLKEGHPTHAGCAA